MDDEELLKYLINISVQCLLQELENIAGSYETFLCSGGTGLSQILFTEENAEQQLNRLQTEGVQVLMKYILNLLMYRCRLERK